MKVCRSCCQQGPDKLENVFGDREAGERLMWQEGLRRRSGDFTSVSTRARTSKLPSGGPIFRPQSVFQSVFQPVTTAAVVTAAIDRAG